ASLDIGNKGIGTSLRSCPGPIGRDGHHSRSAHPYPCTITVDTDTICAISTPPGTGAIALLRVSGPRAVAVTERLAPTLPLEPLFRHAYVAPLIDMDGQFDEGVITMFKGPHSFTGED